MYLVREMPDFIVTLGEITLHLSDYQITGGCLLREQGTSDSTAAVTAVFPKGTRITLSGRLVPSQEILTQAGTALDAALRDGTALSVTLGTLVCTDMRLIGYTLRPGETAAEVKLVCCTQSPLETETSEETEPGEETEAEE